MIVLRLTVARECGVLRVRMLDETSGSRYRARAQDTDNREDLAGRVLASWLEATYPERIRDACRHGAYGADDGRLNADDLVSLVSVQAFATEWLGIEITSTYQGVSGMLVGFVVWPGAQRTRARRRVT